MIPPLVGDPAHLPPGRYRTTLDEVRERFVEQVPQSCTRREIWEGFRAYLEAWSSTEELLAPHLDGLALVRTAWLAGSFVSGKVDPSNLDISIILDGQSVARSHGKPGAKKIKALTHRDGILKRFKVSPCSFEYRFVRSPFKLEESTSPEELEYVTLRGAFDDFWQRTRPADQPKGEPTHLTADWARGYLEVEL